MSDQTASVGMVTNGKHTVAEPDSSQTVDEAPRPFNRQSVDERLDALMRTIREWDWRSAPIAAPPPSAEVPDVPAAGPTAAATPPVDREGFEPPTVPPPSVSRATDDTQTVLLEPTPRHAKGEPLPTQHVDDTSREVAAPFPLEPDTLAPDTVLLPPEEPVTAVTGTVTSPTEGRWETATEVVPSQPENLQGPTTETVPAPGPGGEPLKSKRRSRVKVLLLGLAAIAVLVLIVGGIRLISERNQSPGSGDTTPTTVAPRLASHAIAPAHAVPITSAELAQYKQYAESLQAANRVATQRLAGLGSTPTAADVQPVTSAYVNALNLYHFQLSFIKWPASMESAVTADQSQLGITANFLKAVSLVSPAEMGAWLAQLNARAHEVQATDNIVRQDLNLSKTTSFP